MQAERQLSAAQEAATRESAAAYSVHALYEQKAASINALRAASVSSSAALASLRASNTCVRCAAPRPSAFSRRIPAPLRT